MHLNKIELQNFRNLKKQIIEFPKKVTLLAGNNGQGKTNIIEAVYLLSHAKSFRSSKPVELVNWDIATSCSVRGNISDGVSNKTIEYRVINERRKIFINEKPISSPTEFYGQFRAVEFIPTDLELIKGPPSIRRQFVDKTLAMVDPSYVESLVQYQRALKQRNRALKSTRFSDDLLPWDSILIEVGVKIAQKRRVFLEEILSKSKALYQGLLSGTISVENISLDYQSDFVRDGIVLSPENLQKNYLESRSNDFSRESTNLGIHRDDINFLFDTGVGLKNARKFASQGQARGFSLIVKFCALDYIKSSTSSYPVLLLDDVESELDKLRCKALFQLIARLNCQVIITSTEISEALKLSGISVDVKEVVAGTVP